MPGGFESITWTHLEKQACNTLNKKDVSYSRSNITVTIAKLTCINGNIEDKNFSPQFISVLMLFHGCVFFFVFICLSATHVFISGTSSRLGP